MAEGLVTAEASPLIGLAAAGAPVERQKMTLSSLGMGDCSCYRNFFFILPVWV